MSLEVHLKDTVTGFERVYVDNYEWDDESVVLFQYFEGNYSCDCNRLYFLWDWGRIDGGPDEIDCAAENRIEITRLVWNGQDLSFSEYLETPT